MNPDASRMDGAELREFTARVLHDAATGKIAPDPDDSTPYGRMAEAVIAEVLPSFREQIAQLSKALDLLRPAHHTPYADEEHQGGNCADILMALLAENFRLKTTVRKVREWCEENEENEDFLGAMSEVRGLLPPTVTP